jgi:L-iditol 2-dehydrogenase
MKALVKYAPGDGNLDILDVEEPRCGDAQVKVEVADCGVCGTDLHVIHDTFRNYPPVILGHEFSGTFVEVGSSVSDVSIGGLHDLISAKLPISDWRTAFGMCMDRTALKVLMRPID